MVNDKLSPLWTNICHATLCVGGKRVTANTWQGAESLLPPSSGVFTRQGAGLCSHRHRR
jgi:hypothetical protein